MAVVGNGTATDVTDGSPYTEGTVVDILAVPDTGWVFLNWESDAGGTFGDPSAPDTTFTMPGNDVTVTANFVPNVPGGKVYNQNQDTFYDTIQEAINAADPGDTLWAGEGTYNEAVNANKAITLQSTHGPSVTIIKGNVVPSLGPAITVPDNMQDVVIRGFTIGGSYSTQPGIRLNPGAGGILIENNIFVDNHMDHIRGHGISNTQIINNSFGPMHASADHNQSEAIDLDSGSNNVLISGNTIDLENTGANGLRIINSQEITIDKNMIKGAQKMGGIQLLGVASWSGGIPSNVTISNNEITGHNLRGIEVGFDLGENILITGNSIYGNPVGVDMWILTSGFLPQINANNIYDNTSFGVRNDAGNAKLDATNNWWGDASGPEHVDNPLGTGDEVSNVNYDPWADSPF